MSRSVPEVQRFSNSASSPSSNSVPGAQQKRAAIPHGMGVEFWLLRLFLTACTTALCFKFAPFGLRGLPAAGVGFFLALVILLAELRLRRAEIGGLLGGALGTVLGMFAALLVTLVISRTNEPEPTKSFLEYAALFAFAYLGLVLGSATGGELKSGSGAGIIPEQPRAPEPIKLLDTSVLIDGRIADVCEAHFLDGVLGVPQFVLHELQLVADSSDSLKRQRGRRGLEVLQRMQKMTKGDVRVLDDDFPNTADVDHQLIELAQLTGAEIVTNDFNLNKVATVQAFSVLNVNELANALKPAVLPGETMHVLIQREGKEAMQGVAYLSDGTMVVVDGARRMINKSVDIIVTSVHQTTAGKMIFGRVDERVEASGHQARAAVAGRGTGGNLPQSYTSGTGATREDEKNRSADQQDSLGLPDPDVE